jgi:hypothetical protein
LGVGLTTPRRKKKINLLQKFKRSLGPGRIAWINDLSERDSSPNIIKMIKSRRINGGRPCSTNGVEEEYI